MEIYRPHACLAKGKIHGDVVVNVKKPVKKCDLTRKNICSVMIEEEEGYVV